MADNTRSLTIKNPRPNLSALFNSKYNLQVAKSVITNNQLTFNMVWQSHVLAPNMNVEWKPVYGLNWTTVLDLDAMGMWEQSTAIPKLRYLKVGKNNYQTDTGTNGVHFMVGVQEARYGFSPIFMDPAETGKGMTALYQPQEKVQWWYQSGMHTSTILSENVGPVKTGDFTPPDAMSATNSKTSSYNFQAGQWTTTSP